MATIKRKCDVCNKEYEADTQNIKRDWGLCCSKSCAASKREKNKPSYNTERVEQNIPAAYIAPSYTDLRDSMSFLAQVAAKVAETQKTFYTLQCDKLRQVREEYIRQKVESERRIKKNLRMCGLHPDPRVNFANGVTCTIVSTDNPPKGRSMDWFIEENNKE